MKQNSARRTGSAESVALSQGGLGVLMAEGDDGKSTTTKTHVGRDVPYDEESDDAGSSDELGFAA